MGEMDVFQNYIREINVRLGDEISKFIFKNRIMYSFTGDYSYITNIVDSLEESKLLISEMESYIKHFNTNRIWIFGAGRWGNIIYRFVAAKYMVQGFIDNDKNKYSMKDKRVCSLEEAIGEGESIYITATKKYHKDIERQLIDNNISKDKIIPLYNIWREYTKVLERKQYFAEDIIKKEMLCGGVFIDCGCFDGTNIDSFVKRCDGEYSKIIAFEPNEKVYYDCKTYIEEKYKNAEVICGAVGDRNGEARFDNIRGLSSARIDDIGGNCIVKVYSIDEVLNGEEATFIKMDIEGNELKALQGARITIQKYKPILAISVYHKLEDIWEIASYILSLHKDYRVYFRHYSLQEIETVLYAV